MRLAVKYGFLVAVALIVIRLAIYYLDLLDSGGGALLTWAGYAIITIGLYMGMRDRREAQSGRLTYGEGLGTGVLCSIVMAVATAVVLYIHAKFLNRNVSPEMYAMVEREIGTIIEQGSFSDEQVDLMTRVARLTTSPGGIALTYLFEVFIIGSIISLIMAAVQRRQDIFTDIHKFDKGSEDKHE